VDSFLFPDCVGRSNFQSLGDFSFYNRNCKLEDNELQTYFPFIDMVGSPLVNCFVYTPKHK